EGGVNLGGVRFELLLRPRGDNQIGDLRRKEPPQPAHALDFTHLVGDALFKLLVQLIEITEQSHVLNCYRSLVGECRGQFNLLVGEWTRFRAGQSDKPARNALEQHWNVKVSAKIT